MPLARADRENTERGAEEIVARAQDPPNKKIHIRRDSALQQLWEHMGPKGKALEDRL